MLLDFDGPVCTLLPQDRLPVLAGRFTDVIRARGIPVPDTPPLRADPLESLRFAAGTGDADLTRALEDMMCAVEAEAAGEAPATDGAATALRDLHAAGLAVVIVSNNAAEAIRIHLERVGLAHCVAAVVGRPYARPWLMKPSPAPVRRALSLLSADPSGCVLIGDSVNDVQSATAAGVRCVGYAPDGGGRLLAAGADDVISHMGDAFHAVVTGPRRGNGSNQTWQEL
ncbi:HAD family phosphatase [Streptomyces pactum]|uniref:HAD family phosphatase n=1 Tax=Streptomyces pactum TaxID=68249 RepID=A0ABS0NL37_9ACTN|nr:HAD family phosphatase [Streptomyces pactum]MBH5335915.1 HAD family phosphatase [Streptomyces pactum]